MVPPLNPRPRELAVIGIPGAIRGLIRRKAIPRIAYSLIADVQVTCCRARSAPSSCPAPGGRGKAGVLPLVRRPFPRPACPGAGTAPDRGKPLAGHVPCRLPVLTGPGRILAFLPCQVLTTAAWLL